MNDCLISIIIPCRNEELYIKECINSLVGQKDVPGAFEIIVVDGQSNDKTSVILKDLALKYSNLYVYENKNIYTPFALNIGISQSKGKYIAIMGAHSVYDENFLINSLLLFKEHPEVSCVGGPITSIGLNSIGKGIAQAMSHPMGVGNAKHRFPEYEGYAEMACFPLFRREVFDEIGGYDENLIKNQDDEFCFRLRRKGKLIYISPEVKSSYVVRSSFRSLYRQYFTYGFYRLAVLKKHKIPISYRQLVPSVFFSLVLVLVILAILFQNLSIALILPSVYLLAIIFTAVLSKKVSSSIFFPFIISILILHFSYSTGFMNAVYDSLLKTTPKNDKRSY